MITNEKLLGLTEKQAEMLVQSHGLILRVAERDGESFFGIADFNPRRFNVVIESGRVVEVLDNG